MKSKSKCQSEKLNKTTNKTHTNCDSTPKWRSPTRKKVLSCKIRICTSFSMKTFQMQIQNQRFKICFGQCWIVKMLPFSIKILKFGTSRIYNCSPALWSRLRDGASWKETLSSRCTKLFLKTIRKPKSLFKWRDLSVGQKFPFLTASSTLKQVYSCFTSKMRKSESKGSYSSQISA